MIRKHHKVQMTPQAEAILRKHLRFTTDGGEAANMGVSSSVEGLSELLDLVQGLVEGGHLTVDQCKHAMAAHVAAIGSPDSKKAAFDLIQGNESETDDSTVGAESEVHGKKTGYSITTDKKYNISYNHHVAALKAINANNSSHYAKQKWGAK